MPLTADQKRNRAVAVLIVVAIGIPFVLWWNRPSVKTVAFDILCERFIVPAAANIQLNQADSQIDFVSFVGFEGSVTHAAYVDISSKAMKPKRLDIHALTLGRSKSADEPPPYLELVPQGAFGEMELKASRGVMLASSAAPGKQPWLNVQSASVGDVGFVLQSERASLKLNRYAIPEISPSANSIENLAINIDGQPPGILVELKSGTPTEAPFHALVTFSKKDGEIDLLTSGSGRAVSFEENQLQFSGALKPHLSLDGKSVPGVISDNKVDLRMASKSGRITGLGILSDSETKNGPTLHVRGEVEARSVLQDGHELLPTLVGEVLDKSYPERSAVLVLLGLALYIVFKFVDRALDLLLKLFLPEI